MTNETIIFSEHTKEFTQEELKELQTNVATMTDEELIEFRNSFDPDTMGNFSKEDE